MKWKYIIISILVAFLVVTIIKMIKYEDTIRKERIVEVRIEDKSKPLIVKASGEELKKLSLTADYYSIAEGDYFKVLNKKVENDEKINYWENIFLKGVNIGVAVPGKFPAEFSLTFNEYLNCFKLIGKMNSNVIRTYTILPPEFYEAFAYYNLHNQNKKLYLLHGMWAKIPEKNNYFNSDYTRGVKREIINLIDVIHGNAVIEKQPGHAHGVYVSDISEYVIGLLLGREWEPSAVIITNKKNNIDHFNGDFISMNNGSPMEVWLAKIMDFAALYETQTYKAQRPLSFVNWLPLDPMFHNSEIIENDKVREFDNDLENIDFRKFHTSELFYPGIFAAYHAYPYYPDYIYLQKSYATAINKNGQKDNYFGYLDDLKKHNEGMPLIIAEYGLPSSRGNSHYTPFGLNQGGHSEAEQAKLSVQLTKDIYDTKCGGAIYFEWIDEWFKHNWLVMDFEQPFHNRKLWHNMENPEQNFGIYAYESRTKTINGNLDDWGKTDISDEDISLNSDADPAYFYLTANIPNFNFENNNLKIAIDVFDKDKGDHSLPFLKNEIENGIEFLLDFSSENNANILVDDKYSVFTDIYNDNIPVYSSKENNNGIFVEQLMLTNRGRETLLDKKIDSVMHNRSKLIHGNTDNPEFSNADWFWNDTSKTIEIRLPWHLLNVSDPSNRYVLDDKENTPEIEYSQTDGFNVYLFVTDTNNKINKYSDAYFCSWETWETPEYKNRLKPIYYSLQKYFHKIKPIETSPENYISPYEKFRLCNFYNNKKGAISINFENAGFTQYTYALPILEKYNFKASFGLIPNYLHQTPFLFSDENGLQIKKLGVSEVKELLKMGHDVYLQSSSESTPDVLAQMKIEKKLLEKKLGANILNIGFSFSGNESKSYNSILITNDYPNQHQLDSIIKQGKGSLSVFLYHNLFPEKSHEYQSIKNIPTKKLYSVTPEAFEKQLRLIRNSDYWITPEQNIFKYIKEKENSNIKITKYADLIFLNVVNTLNRDVYDQPLTIKFSTSVKKIKVTGSADDGIYNNREGQIYLNVFPGKEVTIEILER